MTEETAIRIAETLESIAGAIGMMMGLAISLSVIFLIGFFFYIVSKD